MNFNVRAERPNKKLKIILHIVRHLLGMSSIFQKCFTLGPFSLEKLFNDLNVIAWTQFSLGGNKKWTDITDFEMIPCIKLQGVSERGAAKEQTFPFLKS